MSTFLFLVILMAAGVLLWNVDKYPRVAKAGFCLFVIALAAVIGGYHPNVPGILR